MLLLVDGHVLLESLNIPVATKDELGMLYQLLMLDRKVFYQLHISNKVM